MDGYLRQSTASQTRLIGPFVDDTDFKTAKTGLTIANTDIKLRANGTTLSNKNSGGGTHQANGTYSVTWDATDTANVGELKYSVSVSGALQVFGSYVVLEEAVYDALFAASANAFTGAAGSSLLSGIADGAITAAKIADNAIDSATFAADTGLRTIRANTAQAGASTTITLDASASSVDDFYNGCLIVLTGGTGAGQIRIVSDYVGSTKVATVPAWVTNPDNTTTFAIRPANLPTFPSNFSLLSISSGGLVSQTAAIKKNTAFTAYPFLMTDSTNHQPATGLSVTVTRSINGGSFGAGTLSSVTEVGGGIYIVNFAAADLNGNVIILRATATGADDTFDRIVTTP